MGRVMLMRPGPRAPTATMIGKLQLADRTPFSAGYAESFSESSSADDEEFLERLAEMQRSYRLRDVEILEAIPRALTDRALQWFRSVAREARTLCQIEKSF